MFNAKVICDSLPLYGGVRLTTMQCTYPRCIHAELMTHRVFSRNAASSRAIPVEKIIQQVIDRPFIPSYWGLNQSGMQARKEMPFDQQAEAVHLWLQARDEAVRKARELVAMNLHKQIVNRLLEPWMWITVIITATQWSNFFAQRCHPDAEPHMGMIAHLMQAAYQESVPRYALWHLPYVTGYEDYDFSNVIDIGNEAKVSTARCARVSYLNQEVRPVVEADLVLYNRLLTGSHWSPFEHPAYSDPCSKGSGNFGPGWVQFRKTFSDECR